MKIFTLVKLKSRLETASSMSRELFRTLASLSNLTILHIIVFWSKNRESIPSSCYSSPALFVKTWRYIGLFIGTGLAMSYWNEIIKFIPAIKYTQNNNRTLWNSSNQSSSNKDYLTKNQTFFTYQITLSPVLRLTL